MDKVTIIRRWNSPVVHMRIDLDGMSVSMPLAQFVEALALEAAPGLSATLAEQAGNPTTWFTRKRVADAIRQALGTGALKAALADAAIGVTDAMKAETSSLA